jgi:hypothetical protein
MLAEWAAMIQDRDNLARAAVAPGVRKHRVRVLIGISRTTIDRILAPVGPVGPSNGPSEAGNDHGRKPGTPRPGAKSLVSGGGSGI